MDAETFHQFETGVDKLRWFCLGMQRESKLLWSAAVLQERPKTVSLAFSQCSAQTFPVLHKIYTTFLTTPVGSDSCERSFSALRQLKLWTR